MQTTDTGLLFQTSQQIADESNRDLKIAAAEKIGRPIKLSSKVIDLVVSGDNAWTAESGWQARCVDLASGKTKKLYKGHKGPVTSVCLHLVKGGEDGSRLVLFTASWDKTVRVWDAKSGEQLHILEGHTDFVKSVTVLPTSPPLLLSTSSDKSCRLWDLSPLASGQSPTTVQIIKEHTRPVETAAFRVPEDHSAPLTVWTADSMGVIKEWAIARVIESNVRSPLIFTQTVKGHETSVAQIVAVEDGLWSASMDYTAMFHGKPSATLVHPRYVKSVLPLPGQPYVLTGSEDEHIRVWDAANLESTNKTPLSIVEAHCGEVTAFGLWESKVDGRAEVMVVSASLDGTLRRWSVKELLNPPKLDYKPQPPPNDSMMTAEEEAELAELMGSDDE